MFSSHTGGGGNLNDAIALAQPTMRSKFWVIVATASQNGPIKTSSRARVMTVTASQRRCHSRRCTRSISGQVATTSVVAQIVAGTNGHRIQNEVAISPATNSTARMVRTRSSGFAGGGRSGIGSDQRRAGGGPWIPVNRCESGSSTRIRGRNRAA